MKKTIWSVILVVVVIALIWWGWSQQSAKPVVSEPIKIGAILPLSGPLADPGTDIKRGMELFIEENKDVPLELVAEDSVGDAVKGVTAYRELIDLDKPDVVVSAFSGVSIPLIPLAEENKLPLVMTLVAADGVVGQNSYVSRLYYTSSQVVNSLFDQGAISSGKYKKVALLRPNSELGLSISEIVKSRSVTGGMRIVAEEAYTPNTTDFRTQITKIKAAGPEAVIFTSITPTETVNGYKQMKELGLKADIFDATIALSIKPTRDQIGSTVEGAYTLSLPSILYGSDNFVENFKAKFGVEPTYAAYFGYDAVRLIVEGAKAGAGDLNSGISGLKKLDTLNGKITVQSRGEFNSDLVVAKIEDGKLIEAK